ncbi:MAG: hypothetical protein JW774_02750 [Candidatus Aureabacteria bacterium]|nr:hypothetical protein [Candidatus Auribacterota bacterium]
MGWLFESRREKEERENRALEGILKAFEAEIKNPAVLKEKKENPVQDKKDPVLSNKYATAEDLAVFLARQGTINLSDWENYKKNSGLS